MPAYASYMVYPPAHKPASSAQLLEIYNTYAARGNLTLLVRPGLSDAGKQDLSRDDFYYDPAKWAEDVVRGICGSGIKGRKLLMGVGDFLFAAGNYGLHIEHLINGPLSGIAAGQKYHGIESVLAGHECSAMPKSELEAILKLSSLRAYMLELTLTRADGGVETHRFVRKGLAYRFKRAVGRKMGAKPGLTKGLVGAFG